MTMRNALEFVKDVVEAIKVASGVDVQSIVDLNSVDLDEYDDVQSANLVEYNPDANCREAALRRVLAITAFADDKARRLLSLRPQTNEVATFARAILVAATWIMRRSGNPKSDPRSIVETIVGLFVFALRPHFVPSNAPVQTRDDVH